MAQVELLCPIALAHRNDWARLLVRHCNRRKVAAPLHREPDARPVSTLVDSKQAQIWHDLSQLAPVTHAVYCTLNFPVSWPYILCASQCLIERDSGSHRCSRACFLSSPK